VNKTTRNVAIILVIAAAVVVIPGGGRAANLVGAVLSIVFSCGLGFFAAKTYLERRTDIYGLDERHRAIAYGAIAGIVVIAAAASRLAATVPGALAMIVVLGGCGYGLFYVYQAWRAY